MCVAQSSVQWRAVGTPYCVRSDYLVAS